ncbi:hypothetical protein [Candidatus Nitrospira bockiana]
MASEQYSKEIVVSGCKVKLLIREEPSGRWVVEGTVYCGAGENTRARSFSTAPSASREEAEVMALNKAGEILGGKT